MPGARAATRAWLARPLRRVVRLLLAVLGVAVGVGLLSAVLSQNGSTIRGAEDVYRGLAGDASVELVARSPLGMPESVVDGVRRSRSVALAAPSVHDLIGVETERGRFDLWLVGFGADAGRLGGTLATFARAAGGTGAAGGPGAAAAADGLLVSRSIASRLGVGAGGQVTIHARGGARRSRIAAVVADGEFGEVAGAPIVAAPLRVAQSLDGAPGQIHRIAVVPRGSAEEARAELRRVAGEHAADVRSTGFDARAQAQASSLNRNSSSLFAALSLVVGGLLAYASMSLIAAERRREVATLNALGCSSRALLTAVLTEALLVGLAGSVLGVALGRAALTGLLPEPDPLLTSVFIVEHSARMTPGVVALSVAAGVAATLAAAAVPARELVRVPPAEALVGEAAAASPEGLRGGAALVVAPILLAAAGAALSLAGQAVVGVGLIVFAGLLAIPAVVPFLARAIRARVRSPGGAGLVGITEIVAFPSRAVALVAVVTLAVCGTTIITGTASDLSTGVAELSGGTYTGTAVFVRPHSESNVFLTRPIDPRVGSALARDGRVGSVARWRASFVDWNGRRILAFAFDPEERDSRSPGFTRGNPRRAGQALVSDPAAVAVTSDLGTGTSLRPGSRLTVPTPKGPREVHVVANISNYGWAAGAIIFNPASFADWWGLDFVTALKLHPQPGIGPGELARGLEPMLERRGLTASTSPSMRAQARSNADAQLATVSRIGSLIALAGVLAVAAAAMLGVLGRARRITSLRTIGMSSRQVATATLAELACIVLIGAVVGLALGILGRILAVHHLANSVSLPVAVQVSWPQFVRPVVLVAVIAGVATLLAVRASLRLPLRRALDER